MSEKKVEDIDGPVELKQSKIASAIPRVGVSSKGVKLGAAIAVAVIGAIGVGIMTAGNSSKSTTTTPDKTDAPGTAAAIDVLAEYKRKQQQAQQQPPATVTEGVERGQGIVASSPAPTLPKNQAPSQQQSPAEQFAQWKEKHKYERIQGEILAAESALTAPLMKSAGGLTSGGGSGRSAIEDPLAQVAEMRRAALQAAGRQIAAGGGEQLAQLGITPEMPIMIGSGGADPNVAAQSRNRSFLKEMAETGYLPSAVNKKLPGHEVAAGSVIPAVMLTGINSDLPGVITAAVRQTVYSTFDERTPVIPQGTKLIGRYSSNIIMGQERVLVAWDEMIFPNGNRIDLKGMAGVDGIGQAGFADKVDNHFFRVWGSAFLVSMLGVGVQLSQPQNASYSQAPSAGSQAAASAAAALNEAGSKVLEKNLNIAPTITIRPGYTFNVLVNRSILLPAYVE